MKREFDENHLSSDSSTFPKNVFTFSSSSRKQVINTQTCSLWSTYLECYMRIANGTKVMLLIVRTMFFITLSNHYVCLSFVPKSCLMSEALLRLARVGG